jgi:lysophospholipase L1-like esterase
MRVNWSAVVVASAAVAVLAFSGYLVASWPPETPAPQGPQVAGRELGGPSPPSDGELSVLVLGDSFSSASGPGGGPTWPEILCDRLGCNVTTDAADSRGYVSPDGGRSMQAGVAAAQEQRVDVIILAAGFADLGVHPVEQVVDTAKSTIFRLAHADDDTLLVVLSPFSPGDPGRLTTKLARALERISKENRVAYVDATGWLPYGEDLLNEDGDHPTGEGHRRIADEMQQAFAALGIAPSAQADTSR